MKQYRPLIILFALIGAIALAADVRIKALSNTTTTPASDDYVAVDGTTNGTRKMLLSTATINTTGNLTGNVVNATTFNATTGNVTTLTVSNVSGLPDVWVIPIGDETTAITTGTAKVTFRAPYAATVTAVRASVNTASSSGLPTFDINEGGTTILSTKLTIDASELTSTTAATAAVISDTALADDAEITIDIDTAGTGAKGAKIAIYVTR